MGLKGNPCTVSSVKRVGGQAAHVPARREGVVATRPPPGGPHVKPSSLAFTGVGLVLAHGHGQGHPVAGVIRLGVGSRGKLEFLSVGHSSVVVDLPAGRVAYRALGIGLPVTQEWGHGCGVRSGVAAGHTHQQQAPGE